jgi:hypothetical protein
VETAYRVVTELAALIGACGVQHGDPIAKARADLTGRLYVDGVHDSLYRSAGRTLIRAATKPSSSTTVEIRPTAV